MLSILPRPQSSPGYEEHYGLTHRPFSLTLDQRFVYPSRSYSRAVNDVRRALQRREGLVVVTGKVGTGKTLLCRTLLRQLDTPVYVSIVLDPRMTVDDLLSHVLSDFGLVSTAPQPRKAGQGTSVRRELVMALQRFLASLIPLGAYAVLVVDEAQHLDPAALEQLRLLLNFETDEGKLLQIVLVGQPELDSLLRRPEMHQLDQRIARRCELQPLSVREVRQYMDRRLSVAQRLTLRMEVDLLQRWDADVETVSCSVSFTRWAVRAVAEQSRGIPRLVNLLCDRALEIAWERQTHTIDTRVVRAAAGRVNLAAPAVPGIRMAIRTAAVTAALVLLTAGAGTWTWSGLRPAQPPLLPPVPFSDASASGGRALAASEPVEIGELSIADSFNVTVGSFKSASRAATLAAQLEASGLPAFTQQLRNARWHQVIVGPYASESEALTVRQQLAGYGHSDTRVSTEYAPQVDGQHGARDLLLLRSANRVSLVLALTEEPQKVVTQTSADATLEVEAGPLSGQVHAQELTPASGVPFIRRVSLGESGPPNKSVFVRARIMLLTHSRSNVRVAGRRLYIDLWSPEVGVVPKATPPGDQAAPKTPPLREHEPEIEEYREVIGPAVARLTAIEPFVLSAAASPQPEVLSALARTVSALEAWMRTIEPPRQWADTHQSLVSAVGAAAEAVSPEFTGDRNARAREAFAFRDIAAVALDLDRMGTTPP